MAVYKDRNEIKEEAIKLRKEGYGYGYINKILNINALTTVKRWVSHIEVNPINAHKKSRFENLKKTSPVSKSGIRSRLKRDRGNQCQNCKRKTWLKQPITLEVDHIDGNSSNNDFDNLLLLCPNCHSQTPTWRRKKARSDDIIEIV